MSILLTIDCTFVEFRQRYSDFLFSLCFAFASQDQQLDPLEIRIMIQVLGECLVFTRTVGPASALHQFSPPFAPAVFAPVFSIV